MMHCLSMSTGADQFAIKEGDAALIPRSTTRSVGAVGAIDVECNLQLHTYRISVRGGGTF